MGNPDFAPGADDLVCATRQEASDYAPRRADTAPRDEPRRLPSPRFTPPRSGAAVPFESRPIAGVASPFYAGARYFASASDAAVERRRLDERAAREARRRAASFAGGAR